MGARAQYSGAQGDSARGYVRLRTRGRGNLWYEYPPFVVEHPGQQQQSTNNRQRIVDNPYSPCVGPKRNWGRA